MYSAYIQSVESINTSKKKHHFLDEKYEEEVKEPI
jgi:hypothetical protein